MNIIRANFVIAISVVSLFSLLFIGTKVSANSGVNITATPTPSPRPRVIGTPKASPTATPTPTPTATPAATPLPIQTLDELQSKIRQRMFAPEVRRGRIGIKIVSLNSSKVVFENDADKYFMPASNMKNFTVATAIEKLTPDFRFVTSVKAPATPDQNGTIKGNLTIVGRGDVSMSTSFDPAFPDQINHYRPIDMLVDRIAATGVKRVEGDLVGDESYFTGFAIPDTWEWDDLQTYSGAEISAFPLNDNVVDISVKPSAVDSPCLVGVLPQTQLIRIVNRCITAGSGERSLRIEKAINQNVVEVSGSVPVNAREYKESVTFTHVADLFLDLLRQRLNARGITVTGGNRIVRNRIETMCLTCPGVTDINIASLESPPLSLIAAKTMKPSQNMYTETLLWTLGEKLARRQNDLTNSSRLGLSVVRAFLKEIGLQDDAIVQYDGSGLSRHDLITPAAVVALYVYMAKQSRYAQVWRDSLTIGGVDGTLRNRFKGTAAAGNIRGKTGTIDQVSALSGYVKTAAGEELVVSFVVNGVAVTSQRTSLIDDIVVALANFNGKVD